MNADLPEIPSNARPVSNEDYNVFRSQMEDFKSFYDTSEKLERSASTSDLYEIYEEYLASKNTGTITATYSSDYNSVKFKIDTLINGLYAGGFNVAAYMLYHSVYYKYNIYLTDQNDNTGAIYKIKYGSSDYANYLNSIRNYLISNGAYITAQSIEFVSMPLTFAPLSNVDLFGAFYHTDAKPFAYRVTNPMALYNWDLTTIITDIYDFAPSKGNEGFPQNLANIFNDIGYDGQTLGIITPYSITMQISAISQ